MYPIERYIINKDDVALAVDVWSLGDNVYTAQAQQLFVEEYRIANGNGRTKTLAIHGAVEALIKKYQ